MSWKEEKIGFIGAGNMAEAIIGAVTRSGVCSPAQIIASDIDREKVQKLSQTYNISEAPSNKAVVSECSTIFFAVKPQVLGAVLESLSAENAFKESPGKKRIVSIAAGIKTGFYESIIYRDISGDSRSMFPIVRVMPNTPALVSSGTSAVCANRFASEADLYAVKNILSAMGSVFDLDEADMDAFTAVAGSGPAYGFYLVEAVSEAGAELGLERKDSLFMTVSMLKGALRLLEHLNEEPESLRRKVTSPGGTTEAALNVLENAQVKDIFKRAVKAAAERAAELSG